MSLWTGWTSKPPQGTPLDSTHGLRQGLGACFPFNEGSGAPIEIISGVRVALAGTTTWGSSPYGSQLASDGSTGYGTITLPAINNWAAVTVAMLWSCPSSGDPPSSRILEKGANSEWSFLANQNGNPAWWVNADNGAYGATNYVDGNWHKLLGTFDGVSVANEYIDGVFQGTATVTVPSSKTGVLNFFRYGGGGIYSQSACAGLWIWNRLLAVGEIQSWFDNPWQMFAPPLPFWWGQSSTVAIAAPQYPFPGLPLPLLAS